MNTIEQIENLRKKQIAFFSSGKTMDINFRKDSLQQMRDSIVKHDEGIRTALHADLNKSSFEAYATETGIVLHELRTQINNLSHWARPEKVNTPLFAMPSKSWIISEPLGLVFIISPWNYPFNLSMVPLIGAVAAGNVAIIRQSRHSPNTNAVIGEILKESFTEDHIAIVDSDIEAAEAALSLKWDLIFFTGSTDVGRHVYLKAAENLTPVILELGGKCPVIVDEDANLNVAARRIIWGKLINAGQTCIAPDYLFVHQKIKEQLVSALKKEIFKMYGSSPTENPDYPRIISGKAFDRIENLIKGSQILSGGKCTKETLSIEPTLIESSLTDPAMLEEIFGPVLPVTGFSDLNDVIRTINSKEKPLAVYYFSEDRKKQKKVILETSSGACLINDVVLHIANSNLPFGGVGSSGNGRYHGYESFRAFSNRKAIMKSGSLIDIPIKYAPFSKNKEWLIRKFLR
jgi:aldehyde dehydrogenase (NAD+)